MRLASSILILIALCACDNRAFISCEDITKIRNASMERSDQLDQLSNHYELLKGKHVYNSDLRALDNSTKKLYDVAGEVTVLNFWFTTCKPCVQEIPYFNELKQEFEKEDVSFISLALNTPEQVTSFMEKNPFNWQPFLVDDIKYEYCVSSYPTTLILDNNKKIISYKVGGPTDPEGLKYNQDKMRELIKSALSQNS